MDSLITATARALAADDPLGALKRVACAMIRLRSRFVESRWLSLAIYSSACEGAPAKCGGRVWSKRGRGTRKVSRRRRPDHGGFARPRGPCKGAQRGTRDA
jgi:hypothetical protein